MAQEIFSLYPITDRICYYLYNNRSILNFIKICKGTFQWNKSAAWCNLSFKFDSDTNLRHFEKNIDLYSKAYSIELIGPYYSYHIHKFTNVHKLKLIRCEMMPDISSFSKLYELCIRFPLYRSCDFSRLGFVKILKLYECDNLSDASGLNNVYDLTLSNCHNLEDISMLGLNHKLTLHSCMGIENISTLTSVYDLTISSCKNIKNIPILMHTQKIILSSLDITDINGLRFIPDIKIECCYNIKDLSWISDVRRLTINNCDNIYSLDAISSVNELFIYHCNNISDISSLAHVKTLNIDMCEKITIIPSLSSIHSLSLSGDNVKDTLPLINIKELVLCYCSSIRNLNTILYMSSLESLTIMYCDNMELDIAKFSAVKHVQISGHMTYTADFGQLPKIVFC